MILQNENTVLVFSSVRFRRAYLEIMDFGPKACPVQCILLKDVKEYNKAKLRIKCPGIRKFSELK